MSGVDKVVEVELSDARWWWWWLSIEVPLGRMGLCLRSGELRGRWLTKSGLARLVVFRNDRNKRAFVPSKWLPTRHLVDGLLHVARAITRCLRHTALWMNGARHKESVHGLAVLTGTTAAGEDSAGTRDCYRLEGVHPTARLPLHHARRSARKLHGLGVTPRTTDHGNLLQSHNTIFLLILRYLWLHFRDSRSPACAVLRGVTWSILILPNCEDGFLLVGVLSGCEAPVHS